MAVYDINGNMLADITASDSELMALKLNMKEKADLIQLLSDSGMQGACTDGEYIYYIDITQNTLKKYNILTKELTSVSYTSGFTVMQTI